MKLRILSVFAAAALLAACETAPDSSATTGGEGVSTVNQPSTSTSLSESSPEWFAVNVGDRVFFGLDKYDLAGEARRTLELQAAWLKKYPQYKVVVEVMPTNAVPVNTTLHSANVAQARSKII